MSFRAAPAFAPAGLSIYSLLRSLTPFPVPFWRRHADRSEQLDEARRQAEGAAAGLRSQVAGLSSQMAEAKRGWASAVKREAELVDRCERLEELQVSKSRKREFPALLSRHGPRMLRVQAAARTTVLLSEAALRERAEKEGPSGEQVLAAAGQGPGGTAQLWWLELAERVRAKQRQLTAGQAPSSDKGEGVVGAQLLEGRERVASLEGQLRDQGLEVVFLRQELIAKDLELRRTVADAAEARGAAGRRVASLEGALRSQAAEQETKVRELEQSCRTLAGRSDLHAALAAARQTLAGERVAAVHRSGELDVARRLLEAEAKAHAESRRECERLGEELDRSQVARSVEGVAGCGALELIEHFAGIAELQANRIKDLSEALAGKGGWTLRPFGARDGGGSGGGDDNGDDDDLRGPVLGAAGGLCGLFGDEQAPEKITGKWSRHWSTLEAHVLSKQLASVRSDLRAVTAAAAADEQRARANAETLRTSAHDSEKRAQAQLRTAAQRAALAEEQAALAMQHVSRERQKVSSPNEPFAAAPRTKPLVFACPMPPYECCDSLVCAGGRSRARAGRRPQGPRGHARALPAPRPRPRQRPRAAGRGDRRRARGGAGAGAAAAGVDARGAQRADGRAHGDGGGPAGGRVGPRRARAEPRAQQRGLRGGDRGLDLPVRAQAAGQGDDGCDERGSVGRPARAARGGARDSTHGVR